MQIWPRVGEEKALRTDGHVSFSKADINSAFQRAGSLERLECSSNEAGDEPDGFCESPSLAKNSGVPCPPEGSGNPAPTS